MEFGEKGESDNGVCFPVTQKGFRWLIKRVCLCRDPCRGVLWHLKSLLRIMSQSLQPVWQPWTDAICWTDPKKCVYLLVFYTPKYVGSKYQNPS